MGSRRRRPQGCPRRQFHRRRRRQWHRAGAGGAALRPRLRVPTRTPEQWRERKPPGAGRGSWGW